MFLALTAGGAGCAGGAAAQSPQLDALARAALDTAAARYVRVAARLDPAGGYPRYVGEGGSESASAPGPGSGAPGAWHLAKVSEWTSGFFPGTLWQLYAYERGVAPVPAGVAPVPAGVAPVPAGGTPLGGRPAARVSPGSALADSLRAEAERWTAPLPAIFRGKYSHDLGFQFFTTNAAAYGLTGEERYRATALEAARLLAGRFNPAVGAIKSWDWMQADRPFPVIVDNMMNLELLFWGAKHGGSPEWASVALRHAETTRLNHVRPDGGSFHVVVFDPESGKVRARITHQGYADSSTWSRGEAWLVNGFTMAYRETRRPELLETAQRVADYYVAHLPPDGVPCWDFQAPGCPGGPELRDASAAAIAASGLLELARYAGDAAAARYRAAATTTLTTLLSPAYLAGPGSDALLRHATGNRPAKSEIDVGIIYGDYYLVEALRRWLEWGHPAAAHAGKEAPRASGAHGAHGARGPAAAALEEAAPRTILLRGTELLRARALARAGDASLAPALARLQREADAALATVPVSVVEKVRTPPSGDKHDYASMGPYWWPDSTKADGLPYIRKDGQRNPAAAHDSDSPRLARVVHSVETLGLAYWFTGREEYARHAALLLRTWFLDPATRMKPNLEFGQAIPGVVAGRGTGIIDTHQLPTLLDAVALLSGSGAWRADDEAGLRDWFRQYLAWLRTSRNGAQERGARNNHGSWYDVQVADFALFVGDTAAAREAVERGRARIAEIRADGGQPLELARTRSLNYSAFNLDALTELAELGRHVGIDLWHYRAPAGGGIGQATAFVAPYADLRRPWPYRQITPQAPDFLLPQLLRAQLALGGYGAAIRALPAQARADSRALLEYPGALTRP